MKLPILIADCRLPIADSTVSAKAVVRNRQSPIANRKSERGIALIITLILLSVTLVMAIAFLAISNRERNSVTTSTDTITAQLAADSALAAAQAQIIATINVTTNPYSAGLIVSTNFQNSFGYVLNIADPTNVNYDYLAAGGGAVGGANFEQNVANLLYLPRPPVFVVTNQQTGSNEFRYYLDLNRNGRFETNYFGQDIDNLGNEVPGTPYWHVGDPEWIGILERPDVTHGPNNKFVSRYAFFAMPADGSLDFNAIHNQTRNPDLTASDGYFRNEGVGSWELNLAAFLADLNTNEWNNPLTPGPYVYNEANAIPSANTGYAFQDARALLSYRYNFNYNLYQPSPGLNMYYALVNNGIDGYTLGDLLTRTVLPVVLPPTGGSSAPWAGSDNTNHYFALPSDLFDTNKTERGVSPALGFTDRMLLAGNGNGAANPSTYDRYTFYRMLAQLGTDSSPEQDKINLNYANATANFDGNGLLASVTYFPNEQTNLFPWQPLQFFTIAADRLLREYSTAWFQSDPTNYLFTYYGILPTYYVDGSGYGVTNVSRFGLTNQIPSFGITNIPVLMNGRFTYTPAVQRVLQLAANIYDATTNKTAVNGKDYPSVFRPVFYKSVSGSGETNVYIVCFQDVATYYNQVGGLNSLSAALDSPSDVNSLRPGFTPLRPLSVDQIRGNVYGVPWIIGAKKGFPNFNEFSMQDVVNVTRKLQVSRPATNAPPNATNQMYIFSVTNYLGVEFWNSYTNAYTNANLQVVVRDNLSMQMALTNGTVLFADGFSLSGNFPFNTATNFSVWPGGAYLVPFATNFTFLRDSAYLFAPTPQFYNVSGNPNPTFYATSPVFPPVPQILLQVTNRLQAFILDNNHVIDYVHFQGAGSTRNLTLEFQNTNTAVGNGIGSYYTNLVWSTELDNTGLPLGIGTQIGISAGTIPASTTFWKDKNITDEIDGFKHFLNPLYTGNGTSSRTFPQFWTGLAVQAPYSPSATTYEYTTYQANDPLVHYLKSDLNYFGYDPDNNSSVQTGVHAYTANAPNYSLLPDLGKMNARYQPWGAAAPSGETGVKSATYDTSAYNLAFKDPLMKRPDNWDFPANKLPTVGWLGRVHRGTPWQTVYLKASNILGEANQFGNIGTNTWAIWTGDAFNTFHAANSAPIQDRLLFDNFSTALNDNATRGQLSVNMGANGRPSLAAWSAAFSGIVAISNATVGLSQYYQPATNTYTATLIDPAGPVGTGSRIGQLVTNINFMRAKFKNADGLVGVFEHVGDILSTPQFTEQSPFLNWNNVSQQQYGISDELYEWLPQQTLSLLRVDSAPRYVVYSYGQTLKPAPNGVVTSGSHFQMITNYQVVAETATRAVLQVNRVVTRNSDGTYRTNFNTKVEQYNVLPPD